MSTDQKSSSVDNPSALKGKKTVYLIVVTAILTILLVAYYFAVYSYHKQIFIRYNDAVLQEENADLDLEKVCRQDAKVDSLYHEVAFKKALVSLAQTDSAGLVINLPDSLMYLQIRGVKVFETKLNDYELDRFAEQLGINAYMKSFGRTSKLTYDTCNYIKEPIVHIDAPEDTTEAKASKYSPDTAITRPVKITYWLDNQLVIHVEGLKPEADSFWKASTEFLSSRIGTIHRFTINYFTGKIERYHPELVLEVENKDALIIYRALHSRAPVVVYF